MKTGLCTVARGALVVLLSLLLAVSAPLHDVALAEGAEGGPYLAEVRVSVGKTAQKAAEALEAEGWEVLKRDGRPADLNEGANAALKSNRAVVLGYRATAEAAEGITDLAVMNMSGGYSFSDYAELMDKYRDSSIRPFIERFMATVNEYRANAASDDPGCRARADMARTLLNRIVDDDTGGRLGDLLLERTRAELGDAYESLPDDERRLHIDLERALMQGDASMVLQAERLLALAADSGRTTWLERLSELGPDGIAESLGYARPADAEAELASRYQDLAAQLAEGWDDMRARLLAHGAGGEGRPGEAQAESDKPAADDGQVSGMEAETSQDEGDEQVDDGLHDAASVVEDEIGDIVVQDDSAAGGADPLVMEGETEVPVVLASAPAADVIELEGEDEVDLAGLVMIEPPDDVVDAFDEVKVEETPQIVAELSDAMGDMADSGQDVSDTREAAIAAYLRTLPYGDGTLYDLFTRPAEEVTGANISALYPAASCLSEGQAAAIEFLSLADLLQAGSTTGEVLAEVWDDATGLKANAEAAPDVSLYEGVDRTIFSGLTALTSEAMRADALRPQDTDVTDFLSAYRRSALLWASTAFTAIAAAASAVKASTAASRFAQEYRVALQDAGAMTERMDETKNGLRELMAKTIGQNKFKEIGRIEIRRVLGETDVFRVTMTPKWDNSVAKISQSVIDGEKDAFVQYYDKMKEFNEFKKANSQTMDFSIDSGLKSYEGDFSENFDRYFETVEEPIEKTSKWSYVSSAFSIAFFFLTVASVVSTAVDIYDYYNVDYAPIPGYMVDVSDITQVADDGTTTVVRNDRAYYKAVSTDAKRKGEDLVALKDYADLNGDAGKEWVALYAASRDGQAPILADSLKVVTGTNTMPDGYSTGIHEFGSDSAANLTDARYCYNDDAGGVYAYFRRDEGAASVAGSAFGGGSSALWAGAGLAVGAAAGAGVTAAVGRRRRESASA